MDFFRMPGATLGSDTQEVTLRFEATGVEVTVQVRKTPKAEGGSEIDPKHQWAVELAVARALVNAGHKTGEVLRYLRRAVLVGQLGLANWFGVSDSAVKLAESLAGQATAPSEWWAFLMNESVRRLAETGEVEPTATVSAAN